MLQYLWVVLYAVDTNTFKETIKVVFKEGFELCDSTLRSNEGFIS